MQGDDEILIETTFRTFLVRVDRFRQTPLTEAQREDGLRLASELRFALGFDPDLQVAAQRLQHALLDNGPLRLRRPDSKLETQRFFEQLRDFLEGQLEAGRLIVLQEPAIANVPEQELAVRKPRLDRQPGELSPSRSALPETNFFDVRFVDEVGQAINGIEIQFRFSDETRTVTTNAAGVALVEDVTASVASLTGPDPDSLAKVVEPRWTKRRSGRAPGGVNAFEKTFSAVTPLSLDVKAAVPNVVIVKPSLGTIHLELFDKTGRVRHALRDYQLSGPEPLSGTTDEHGGLRHDQVFPGDYTLKLEIVSFKGDPDETEDDVTSPVVVLDPTDSQAEVRRIGAVPRSVLARLHGFFNTNKTFLLPTALPSVEKLRQLYDDNAPCQLLVVGHADTKGGAAYNDQLSLERAQATIAYLKDDHDAWLKFYGADIEQQKRWGKVEDHLMIISMPDFSSKPKGEDAIVWYQRTRDLAVDGKAGKDTRTALISEYMGLDGVSLTDLLGEVEPTAHGCGENFPLDDSGEHLDEAPADEKRDPGDRRVELFFFDDEFGITPPVPGDNSDAGSPEYPKWLERAELVELRADELDGPTVTFVEMADAHFRFDSSVVMPEGEAPDDSGEHQALTSVGVIATALRFNEEEAGKTLLVAGHTDTTGQVDYNQKLSEERAEVTLCMLVGGTDSRDRFAELCDGRHGVADYKQILSWAAREFADQGFNCDPGQIDDNASTGVEPVRSFQNAYNANKATLNPSADDLDPDGSIGPLTWKAIFDCYELALQTELGTDAPGLAALRAKLNFEDPQRKSLGFSEYFPIEELGVDEFRSQTNRRVEILFFDPGEAPDLVHAEDDPETSELYLPGNFQRDPLDPRGSAKASDRATGIRAPTRFSRNKSFPKPSLLPALRAALQLLAGDPELSLVIVGHCDPVGFDADNFALSLERAEAVRAWLIGDAAFFSEQFDDTTAEAWDFEEIQWMLHAVQVAGAPCYVGQADGFVGRLTEDAIARFQLSTTDLAVNGVADAATVASLINAYLALPGGVVAPERIEVVGGGSWCPPQPFLGQPPLVDDPLLRDQRRVDLFVFSQPPRPAVERFPRQRALPTVYNGWCNQTGTELPMVGAPFVVQAYDPGGALLANTSLQLVQVVDDQSTAPVGSVTTDAAGCATVTAPPGTYLVQAQFGGGTALLSAFELDPDTSCGAALAFEMSGGLTDLKPALG